MDVAAPVSGDAAARAGSSGGAIVLHRAFWYAGRALGGADDAQRSLPLGAGAPVATTPNLRPRPLSDRRRAGRVAPTT